MVVVADRVVGVVGVVACALLAWFGWRITAVWAGGWLLVVSGVLGVVSSVWAIRLTFGWERREALRQLRRTAPKGWESV